MRNTSNLLAKNHLNAKCSVLCFFGLMAAGAKVIVFDSQRQRPYSNSYRSQRLGPSGEVCLSTHKKKTRLEYVVKLEIARTSSKSGIGKPSCIDSPTFSVEVSPSVGGELRRVFSSHRR